MPVFDALALDYEVMETVATPEDRLGESNKAVSRGQTYAELFSPQGI